MKIDGCSVQRALAISLVLNKVSKKSVALPPEHCT